ncbi:MAG TPA: hypothetical protein VGF93_09725 [Solirubrobacteraceae bacterium]
MTPELLLAIARRSKLASFLMGRLVALGDLPAQLVEGLIGRRTPWARFLARLSWFLSLLGHLLHSSSLV